MSTRTKFNIPPKSRFRGLRLDAEIFELIRQLNGAGFETYMSCAGHRSKGSGKGMVRGFIAFKRCNDKEGIVKILGTYRLRNIRIQDQIEDADPDFYYRGKVTLVSFDPIGKPKGSFDGIYDQLDCERQLELFKGGNKCQTSGSCLLCRCSLCSKRGNRAPTLSLVNQP